MRSKRIEQSSPEEDLREKLWWDENCDLIEKIWAQSIQIQSLIRLPYLKRMKEFFLKDSNKRVLLVLEIGCGTGWVGRLVADERVRILGSDFSSGQLKMALSKSKEFNVDKWCSYELADASTFRMEVDGVLIHALLHHLSDQELKLFFFEFSKIRKGTRIFIYEPVFFYDQTEKPSILDRVMNRVRYLMQDYVIRFVKWKGQFDNLLDLQVKKLFDDAEKDGWYLSPKEVPFYEGELEAYLTSSCTIMSKYIVNRTDLVIAQALTLNRINRPGRLFSRVILPLAVFVDRLIFKGKFRSFVDADQHLFVCFEVIKN